ncbi:MAG: glycoside hydrolase family 25 protein [Ruminococcus flavefaciens]|nr:glycoside hydrolase family 25 protein [Ruminococcus flavefaciens]MCM1062777.1 glycoside hydrolase family 25 protein [Eubacterium sp.]
MTKSGIDVSEHQGDINWNAVRTDFCIIRAGYGREISQKDKQFEANYNGCKSRNIPCGAYWYSYAVTPEEARKEAAVCLEVIKEKQFEYPIYFDIEEDRQLRLGKSVCSEIAKAFLETVEKAGYFVGIYSSKSHLESYISEELRKRYAVWVAHYGVAKTSYSGDFGIWQKSSSGSVFGISGYVDLNESYIDYPSVIKENELNGFRKNNEPQKLSKSVTLTIDGVTYEGTLTEK